MLHEYRVLIAGKPSPDMLEIANRFFASGCEVTCVRSAEEAVQAARGMRADIVLIDGELPGMDFSGTIRRLREHPETNIVPAVLIAAGDGVAAGRGLDAGFDDFLTKPVDAAELLARVRSLVQLKKMREYLGERTRDLSVFSVPHVGGNGRKRVVLIAGEERDAAPLRLTLDGAGYDTMTAGNGSAAWEAAGGEQPDVILSAGPLPDMTGMDLLLRVTASPLTEDIPVILLSPGSPPAFRTSAIEAGADDCFLDPACTRELLARIRAALRKSDIRKKIQDDQDLLFRFATTDPLTGLYNRQYLEPVLLRSIASLRRYGRRFSLLMIDIDGFKRVNDRYGTYFGDRVLKEFGEVLTAALRSSDIAARYGGDEFIVVLSDAAPKDAATTAERLRTTVAGREFGGDGAGVRMTVSVGGAGVGQDDRGAEDVIRRAGDALYRAKQEGKNRALFR